MIPRAEKEKDKKKEKTTWALLLHGTFTAIFEEHGYAQSRDEITQKYQVT